MGRFVNYKTDTGFAFENVYSRLMLNIRFY